MRPQVGQVINNKYRLLRLIGDGGMGTVYEARHEVLGTSVALKFLHAELARRQGLVQRFLQEARVSAQIQSPHVVRVTDVDQAPGGAFIVMEYLEGKTLQTLYEELYRAGRQLEYADGLEFAMQMLEGVEAAHKQGIVHRDLKPDNVMITQDAKGRTLLKLLDFGIAKLKASGEYDRGLTRPGVIMGTPEYMAPEQAFSADAVDARADIFSLGVMVFEMLAGRRPVGGDEPHQIAAAYISGQIAHLIELAPSIAPELAAVVHRAMAATADGRWQSVTSFRDAIEPFAAAAKAPSAMPMGTLSNPSISRVPPTPDPAAITPAATNIGEALAAASAPAVPQTLPPPVNPDATNPADPPEMSSNGRGPTPMGGFIPGDADHAASAPGYMVPPTKEAAPYIPEGAVPVDPAATAFASPLAVPLSFGGAEPLTHGFSPRPSGTAVGDFAPAPPPGPDAFGGPAGSPAGGYPVVTGAPAVGPAPYAPPIAAAAPAKPRRRSSFLGSIPGILLLASVVAGAVVGGVYLAQSHAKVDDHEDPAPPPTVAVRVDPPPEVPTAGPTQPPGKPPPQFPPRKSPPPRGSGTPNQPPPSPSGTPSSRPLLPLFPIVLPSSLPFGFPFEPPPRQSDPPRSRPDLPRNEPDAPPRRRPRDPQLDQYGARPEDGPPQRRQRLRREPPPDAWDDYGRQPRRRPRPDFVPYGPPRGEPDDFR